jgi:guanylate kinase
MGTVSVCRFMKHFPHSFGPDGGVPVGPKHFFSTISCVPLIDMQMAVLFARSWGSKLFTCAEFVGIMVLVWPFPSVSFIGSVASLEWGTVTARSGTLVENSEQDCGMKSGKGRLIVLTGPTAAGKGTVEANLLSEHPEVWVSVSATTRDPRPGEINGKNYWFMDEQEFRSKEAQNWFLETAVVHGMAYYGTPLQPVLDHLKANIPTILEIDLQGARRVKQRASELNLEIVSVFIAPPSYDELVRRLIGRGTENEEQRKKRLETAKVEMAAESEFDVTIINDSVDRAADELWNVIVQEYGVDA